jgi:hypothetical protein
LKDFLECNENLREMLEKKEIYKNPGETLEKIVD